VLYFVTLFLLRLELGWLLVIAWFSRLAALDPVDMLGQRGHSFDGGDWVFRTYYLRYG